MNEGNFSLEKEVKPLLSELELSSVKRLPQVNRKNDGEKLEVKYADVEPEDESMYEIVCVGGLQSNIERTATLED